jgi:DNA-binding NtrC family response regulator
MVTQGKPLRVLLVEDSETDAELLLHELAHGGYAVAATRVDTADAMQAALQSHTWDIVVSDYSMPAFSAPAALALLRTTGSDLPFIIVSGTIGEETAVAALKAGACDFLVKGRLARLVPALERELREAELCSKSNCGKRRRWKPSASWPEASRTISTICSRRSWGIVSFSRISLARTNRSDRIFARSWARPSERPPSPVNCSPSAASRS